MATHDYVLDNATGANFRSDLNNALAAIVSNNSSSSEPSTKYAYQWWADTNDGVLKIRNSSNDGWVTLLQLDGTLTLEDGSNSAPALGFRDDLNTGIFSSAADTLDITCGGTTRGSFSSSGLTVTGNVTATTFVGNVDAVDGDFDGTLEADAITVAGVALNTVIAGVASTNVTVADESSDTTCFPLFVTAATGDLAPKTGSNLAFNSSNGTLTATAFAGDGSALTGVGGITINSNVNNRILTATGNTNEIDAEGNFTFGSDVVQISSTTQGLGASFVNTGNEYTELKFSANRTSALNALGIINAKWNNNHTVASIYLQAGSDTTNKDDGQIQFFTAASGGSGQSRLTIKNDGDIDITDGNLIIGTNGHGIDFSATADPGQTGTTQENELFSDYEEGTWSPEYNSGSSSSACFASGVSYSTQVGVYRKIGKMVYFILKIQASSATAKSGQLQINRLPFSAGDFSSNATAGGAYITLTNAFTGTAHMPTAFISGSQSNIKFFQTNSNSWAGTDLDTPTGFIHLAGAYPTSS